MSRSRPQLKSSTRIKHKPNRTGQTVLCRSLVVVDSSRTRRRALADCQRARTTFKKAETELEVYESRDKPAYLRWYRAEFGPKIEELKSCIDAMNALRERMARLRRFADMKRCGVREATRIYERSIEEFERIEAKLRERWAREEEEANRRREKEFERFKDEVLGELLGFLRLERAQIRRFLKRGKRPGDILGEILLSISFDIGMPADLLRELLRRPECAPTLKAVGLEGALDEAWDPGYDDEDMDDDDIFGVPFDDPSDDPRYCPAVAQPADNEARIKVLWRELAFALHPDQSDSGSDPAKLDLWHQVQEAMAARDVDRLEVLHAHMQVLRGELSSQAPVSRLMALTAMYRASRDALRRKIRELRKNVEWGFAASGEERRGRLKGEMAGRLQGEVERARGELNLARAQYEREYVPRGAPSSCPERRVAPGQMIFADMEG